MLNTDLVYSLQHHFSGKKEFTTKELMDALQNQLPDLSGSTLSWKLNQLKKDKLIFQIGRGLYTFVYKPEFSSELNLKSKRLYNRVNSLYSGDLVIWDTILLSEISGQEFAKYWVFLSVSKDNLDFLFTEMLSFSKKVFLQPDKETTTRYLFPQEEAIILTPLISETPIIQSNEYTSPSIEGILVNAYFEYDQYLHPIGLDIKNLFQQALTKYNVNKSKLLRYAARRDKRKEINELLKSIK